MSAQWNGGSRSPMSIAEIDERLDVHPNTVRFHLESLVGTGQVEQVDGAPAGPGRPLLLFRAHPGRTRPGLAVTACSPASSPAPHRRARRRPRCRSQGHGRRAGLWRPAGRSGGPVGRVHGRAGVRSAGRLGRRSGVRARAAILGRQGQLGFGTARSWSWWSPAPGADAGRDGRPLYPGHSRAARPVRRTRSMPCAPRRNRPQAADGQVSHARPGGEEPIHEPGGGGGHGGDIRVARDGAGRLVPGDAVEVPRARGHRAHWPGHRTPGLPCPQYGRSGPRRRVGGRVRRRRRGGPQRGVECGRRGRPGGAAGADPATVDAPVEPGPHRCEITRIA